MEKINQYNKRGQRHGYWEGQSANNHLKYKGNFSNDNQVGYWVYYEENGDGVCDGYWECFNKNRFLKVSYFFIKN